MLKRLSAFLFGKEPAETETPPSPASPRPALTVAPAPLKPPPEPEPKLLTRNWIHPFGDRSDVFQQLTHLAKATAGYYPMGVHGTWHGGVHFDGGTAGVLDQSRVLCMADGEVVAYRIPTTTPTTRYAVLPKPAFDAPCASGFVLVRHRIQAPAIAGCDETPPALTFYSLYMHLEDWAAYDGTKLERPVFWAESEAKWVKDDADDLWRRQRGLKVTVSRFSSHTVDILAPGTEVTVSGEGSHRRLENSRGPSWLRNEDGTLRGYVAASQLGMRVGDLMQVKADRLNVRAAPDPQAAVLGQLPRYALVEVSGNGDFCKLHYVEQHVVATGLRSEFIPTARDCVFVPEKPVPIKAGELIGHIGPYQNSRDSAPRRQLHLEVFSTDFFPNFLETSRAWAKRLPAKEKTWLKLAKGTAVVFHRDHFGPRAHPTAVNDHHLSDNDLLVPKSLLDNLPTGRRIHRPATNTAPACNWYRLEGLFHDTEGRLIDGWVQDKVGETSWVSPWDWEGYEVIETSRSPVLGMAYRMYRDKNTSEEDRNRLCKQANEWDQGALMTRLYEIIDRNHDRNMCADEVRTALNSPVLAQALSRIVLSSESEWYWRQEKWDALDDVFGHTTSAPLLNWIAEKERIEALSWWGEVIESLDLRRRSSIYFLHPLGIAGQFIVDDNDLRWLKVPFGQLTFDVEGNDTESSRYFSRVIHWPGGASGVTIGRGYDLGQCPNPEEDLRNAGVKEPLLSWLLKSKGLKGEAARAYFNSASRQIAMFTITRRQQYELFINVYQVMRDDVVRVSSKVDTSREYGRLFWESTHPTIKDVMVDLRFRGDYGTNSRRFLQKPFVDNDLEAFRLVIQNQDNWPNVPRNRFTERARYVRAAR